MQTPSIMVLQDLPGDETRSSRFTVAFFVTFDDTFNPYLLISSCPYPDPRHTLVPYKISGLGRGYL